MNGHTQMAAKPITVHLMVLFLICVFIICCIRSMWVSYGYSNVRMSGVGYTAVFVELGEGGLFLNVTIDRLGMSGTIPMRGIVIRDVLKAPGVRWQMIWTKPVPGAVLQTYVTFIPGWLMFIAITLPVALVYLWPVKSMLRTFCCWIIRKSQILFQTDGKCR